MINIQRVKSGYSVQHRRIPHTAGRHFWYIANIMNRLSSKLCREIKNAKGHIVSDFCAKDYKKCKIQTRESITNILPMLSGQVVKAVG